MTKIASMSDAEFRALVDRDLRRASTKEEAAGLRDPAVVERWYLTLTAMKKSVEGQLGAKRAEFDGQKARLRQAFVQAEQAQADAKALGDQAGVAKAQNRIRKLREEWASVQERFARPRAATLRFQSGVDETLLEARSLRSRLSDENARLRAALLAAREVLDWIDAHGCDDDSRAAEKGWKAIDAAL